MLSPIMILALVLAHLLSFSAAQFPPAVTFTNVTRSPANPNITVSFKSPSPGTCTTVFDYQKQYSGYISLPPFTLAPVQQDYPINTFFWFIESRQNASTAPLTIWLNGGPGSSSMIGLFEETGPCEVVELSDGSFGTQARAWGWDRSSNVLFIDQPVQVGLSYDTIRNGSHNLVTNEYAFPPEQAPSDQPAFTFLNGSFASNDSARTANTSEIAAHTMWHLLQAFLGTFPQYNPGANSDGAVVDPTGINLFTESYGGTYGPAFASLFEEKNTMRANGTISSESTLEVKLSSLGIINGLIDQLVQLPSSATFPTNNTYGLDVYSTTDTLNLLNLLTQTDGCEDQIKACRNASEIYDPNLEGGANAVNKLCYETLIYCSQVEGFYNSQNRSAYDIRRKAPDVIPSGNYQEYLNYASVQESIGARVNYTESSSLVQSAFIATGDSARSHSLDDLAYLLELGIRVALIYGDADYICNWVGGEAVSLQLASRVPAYARGFPAAGYAEIVVNSSYVGGAVRQYGNLSFSRIYDAGHMVPAYQPETAFTLFTRIIEGTELSTGEIISNSSMFSSTGPQNATHTNKMPSATEDAICWLRAIDTTCSDDQISMMLSGKGTVIGGAWYEDSEDYEKPATTVMAGKPGTPLPSSASSSLSVVTGSGISSTIEPTGVYTATATPTSSSGADAGVHFHGAGAGAGVAAAAVALVAGFLT
ncbi:Alpha/Beta hydrolase protein [Phyllosticta citricarpa]